MTVMGGMAALALTIRAAVPEKQRGMVDDLTTTAEDVRVLARDLLAAGQSATALGKLNAEYVSRPQAAATAAAARLKQPCGPRGRPRQIAPRVDAPDSVGGIRGANRFHKIRATERSERS
jgi:hypothetical protein